MTEKKSAQAELTQSLVYNVNDLLIDVRPLRALFEDLALEVRTILQSQGVTESQIAAALDLRYEDHPNAITVPFLLEIENTAVCLADPLPLDAQALRQAVEAFHIAHEERYGSAMHEKPVLVVKLRVGQ